MGIWHHRWLHIVGGLCVGASLVLTQSTPGARAVEPAESQIAQVPDVPPSEAALNRGLALIQQGAVVDATAAFREAIALDPNSSAAHYNLGLVLRQTGELQEAATAFWKALEADPEFAMAYSNLGAALWEGGNLDQAQEYLERAIQLQPDLGNAYYNLGLVQLDQQNYEA
ncbi:MAG: tetratricopeptide repeat protein, partial [Cyanobacteria bacterium P01_D01_bin.115]